MHYLLGRQIVPHWEWKKLTKNSELRNVYHNLVEMRQELKENLQDELTGPSN